MPLTNDQKLKFIQVLLEGFTEGNFPFEELEPVLVEVAVEFLKELQEQKK